MIVEVDFGIDAPKTKMEETSVPVYAQTGGGVRYQQIAVQGAGGATSFRTVPVYDAPHVELVGYEDVIYPGHRSYENISACECARELGSFRGQAPGRNLDASTLAPRTKASDLRKYLPLLASASVG